MTDLVLQGISIRIKMRLLPLPSCWNSSQHYNGVYLINPDDASSHFRTQAKRIGQSAIEELSVKWTFVSGMFIPLPLCSLPFQYSHGSRWGCLLSPAIDTWLGTWVRAMKVCKVLVPYHMICFIFLKSGVCSETEALTLERNLFI